MTLSWTKALRRPSAVAIPPPPSPLVSFPENIQIISRPGNDNPDVGALRRRHFQRSWTASYLTLWTLIILRSTLLPPRGDNPIVLADDDELALRNRNLMWAPSRGRVAPVHEGNFGGRIRAVGVPRRFTCDDRTGRADLDRPVRGLRCRDSPWGIENHGINFSANIKLKVLRYYASKQVLVIRIVNGL